MNCMIAPKLAAMVYKGTTAKYEFKEAGKMPQT